MPVTVPQTMVLEFEWRVPWADGIAEDHELQERAAGRLATYLLEGRLFAGRTGQPPVRVLDAQPVWLADERLWVVVAHLEVPVEVRVG